MMKPNSKKFDKEKIKQAIEFYEEGINGLDKISGGYAVVKNLRERKDKYIADIIIGVAEEGWKERYNYCEYPKELIEEIIIQLAERETNTTNENIQE